MPQLNNNVNSKENISIFNNIKKFYLFSYIVKNTINYKYYKKVKSSIFLPHKLFFRLQGSLNQEFSCLSRYPNEYCIRF